MRNEEKLTAYRWTIAFLLLVLAVICVVWLMQPGETFEEAREQFSDDLISYRAQVGTECTFTATSTAADRAECDRVLNELADVLRDFRDDIDENIATTSTSTLRTTTPTTTATGTATTSDE